MLQDLLFLRFAFSAADSRGHRFRHVAGMPRARISVINVDVDNVGTKAEGERLLGELKKNQNEILADLDVIHAELDDESKLADEEDMDDADDADDDDPSAKMAKKEAKWQHMKTKYRKYADNGKVDKLERAIERQKQKLQKAVDKGKPEEYLAYKQAKIDFTTNCKKSAQLMYNLKKAGLM